MLQLQHTFFLHIVPFCRIGMEQTIKSVKG